MPISNAARTALFAQETDKVFLALIAIEHPSLPAPIYFVNDGKSLVSNGKTYLAFPFTVDLLDQDPDKPPVVNIVIDNVSLQIIAGLRTIASAPTVTLSLVMADTPDTIEAGPFQMTLKSVVYDALTIQGQLAFEDVLNETYPGDTYTPANFPGLF